MGKAEQKINYKVKIGLFKVFDEYLMQTNYSDYFSTMRDMAKAIGITYEGYHKWIRKMRPDSYDKKNKELEYAINNAYLQPSTTASYNSVLAGIYGAPRIHTLIAERGLLKSIPSVSTIARVMKKLGLTSLTRRNSTKRRPKHAEKLSNIKYPNVLNRKFDQKKPNRFWVIDITEIENPSQMRIYLCAILDLYNREVIGWSLDTNAKTDMVIKALDMAISNRQHIKMKKLYLHSDNGSQFKSIKFEENLGIHKIKISRSKPYTSKDNSVMERFFGSLKDECLKWNNIQDIGEAEYYIRTYIAFYNEERIFTKMGISPQKFLAKRYNVSSNKNRRSVNYHE